MSILTELFITFEVEKRICDGCGEDFDPKHWKQRFCSVECRSRSLSYKKDKRLINAKSARKNPVTYLVNKAHQRAKASEIPFTITTDNISVPKECPIFRVALDGVRSGKGIGNRNRYSLSLDQKIPNAGYTPENTWVISSLANTMKNDATPEELSAFIQGFLRLDPKIYSLPGIEHLRIAQFLHDKDQQNESLVSAV